MQLRLSNSQEHDKYVELCSLFCTGSLDPEEAADFEKHLVVCDECRLLLADYKELVAKVIPHLADESQLSEVPGFDRELKAAKKNLFARLDQGSADFAVPDSVPRVPALVFRAFPIGLAVVLSMSLGAVGYWLGVSHQRDARAIVSLPSQPQLELSAHLEKAKADRDRLDIQLKENEQVAQDLNQRIAQQLDEIAKLRKQVQGSEQGDSQSRQALSRLSNENAILQSDRDGTIAQLQKAEKSAADLKERVDHLESERVANLLESASLQKTVADLTARLASPDAGPLDTQKLLASDRDIRELMGARDLLIADVADVDRDGTTRKPFGRIFYTKNKSLIFYAFDLDKSRGFHNTKAFQAWGAKSTDGKSQPVSMGIFYLDNEANRRWVLKFDDPRVLQQIDSVFVTLEPKGGSEKPSRNQLLYAYLLTRPNHP